MSFIESVMLLIAILRNNYLRTVALGAADIGCLFLERLTPGGMAPVGEERGESVLPDMRRTPA